jgi:hypothetical protein
MAETVPHPNNLKVKFRGEKPKKLPAHAKKLAKRGMISEKAMAKMKGEA